MTASKETEYAQDECASCQWCEPEKMDLKPCTSCSRPTCLECRTKNDARCGYCASYDFPRRFKILLQAEDDGLFKADVIVHVMKFDGIGVHYYVNVEQNPHKDGAPKRGWDERGQTMRAHRIREIILIALRKHYPGRKDRATIYFKQNRVRRWFYREGD